MGTSLATAPSPFVGHDGVLQTNGGVSFRVWAPYAASVALAGTFNGWSTSADLLAREVVETNERSIFRSNVAAGAVQICREWHAVETGFVVTRMCVQRREHQFRGA